MTHIYKKTVLIFSLLLCTFLNAQIEKPKPATTTPTPAKPKPAPQPKINPATVLTLKVKCNLDAEVFVDDESRGQATAATIKKVFLGKGEFQLKFVSTANSADVYVITYVVTSQDINSEKILDVNLITIKDKRIALELKNACPKCHGNGSYNTNDTCSNCGGDGKEVLACQNCSKGLLHFECTPCDGSGRIIYTNAWTGGTTNTRCTECNGDGKTDRKCPKCAGTGKLEVACSKCKGVGKVLTKHSCSHY